MIEDDLDKIVPPALFEKFRLGGEIAALVTAIRFYRDGYYNTKPLVSDSEYDNLKKQLREMVKDYRGLYS